MLPARIEYQIRRFKFPIQVVIAEKRYGIWYIFLFLRKRSLRAYIHLHEDNLRKVRITIG